MTPRARRSGRGARPRWRSPAWLVGGAVRDRLLGRPTADYDVAVCGRRAGGGSRAGAGGSPGHPFELSEGFGAWRVVARDRRWNIDLLPLAGESIEADLARRDLTINAMAQPLPDRRADRPLRRAAGPRGAAAAHGHAGGVRGRIHCGRCGSSGWRASSASSPSRRPRRGPPRRRPALAGVSAERVFAELKRIIVSDRALGGLRLMDELRITPVLLPEVSALHGVEQSAYHHLDVYEHTLAVLGAGDRARARSRGLSSGLTRRRSTSTCPRPWPTSSRAGRPCGWARCYTTSPSR